MRPLFVLLHSPVLGPRSWQPVATALAQAGHHVAVPSLLEVGREGPPVWPHVRDAVREALRTSKPDRPVVLVAHSNASFSVPLLTTELDASVRGCVLVDATLPVQSGETPVVPSGTLPSLRAMAAADGSLPPWTDWWDDAVVRALFPDDATRQAVAAEQPRLPLSYFEQHIPVPDRWDNRPCAYVQFSPPYNEDATRARERGWRVEALPGEHLHMLLEPVGVARVLATVIEQADIGNSASPRA